MNEQESNKKKADETANELIKLISDNMVKINSKNEILKYFYENLGWETETSYIIEEALGKLGLGLAMLEMDLRAEAEEG